MRHAALSVTKKTMILGMSTIFFWYLLYILRDLTASECGRSPLYKAACDVDAGNEGASSSAGKYSHPKLGGLANLSIRSSAGCHAADMSLMYVPTAARKAGSCSAFFRIRLTSLPYQKGLAGVGGALVLLRRAMHAAWVALVMSIMKRRGYTAVPVRGGKGLSAAR